MFARYQKRDEKRNIVRTYEILHPWKKRQTDSPRAANRISLSLSLSHSLCLFAIDQSERNRTHEETCSSRPKASRGTSTYDATYEEKIRRGNTPEKRAMHSSRTLRLIMNDNHLSAIPERSERTRASACSNHDRPTTQYIRTPG